MRNLATICLSLALATATLTTESRAQFAWNNVDFPAGVTLSVAQIGGEPALVAVWTPDYATSFEFARFWWPQPGQANVQITPLAAGMIDPRPCAQGAQPLLTFEGDNRRFAWPAMPASGLLLSPALPLTLGYQSLETSFTSWHLSYCDAGCSSSCSPTAAAPLLVGMAFRVGVR